MSEIYRYHPSITCLYYLLSTLSILPHSEEEKLIVNGVGYIFHNIENQTSVQSINKDRFLKNINLLGGRKGDNFSPSLF